MGNQSNSQGTSVAAYSPDLKNWIAIGQGQNYQIWRNTQTHEELEQYIFTATDAKEFSMMKRVFEFRYEKDFLVASRYFKEQNNSEICSTFYQGTSFIERIPLRLNQINDLPHPDSLHVLNSCLRGFKELYTKIGSFDVNSHMIGINSEAKVKVWLNADFGKGRNEDNINARRQDQRKMVSQIILLVDRIIDHRTEPESLTQFVSKNFSPNFEQALTRLQEYSLKHQTSIPPYLISIALLRDRGFFKKMTPRLGASIDGARLTEMRIAKQQQQLRNINHHLAPGASDAFLGGTRLTQIPINYQVPIPIPTQIPQIHPYPVQFVNQNNLPNIPIPITTIPPSSHVQSSLGAGHGPQAIQQSIIPNTVHNQNFINTTSAVTPFQNPVPFRFPHKIQNSNHQSIQNYKPTPTLVSIPNQIQLKLTKVTTPNPQAYQYKSIDNNTHFGSSKNQIRNHPHQYIQHSSSKPQHQLHQQQSTTIYPVNSQTVYPSETGSALDKLLQRTRQIEQVSQQNQPFGRSSEEGFKIVNFKNQKPSTSYQSSTWNKQDGYTDPDLLKINVKDYQPSNTSYQTSYETSSYNKTQGGTDPSLLSKAVSGILNLIDKKPQSSYQNYSSDNTYSQAYHPSQGSNRDFLSKMTDFKYSSTPVDRGSIQSNFSFDGRKQNNQNDLLTALLVGGIIAAPEDKLKEMVGSGPDIMNIINQSKTGASFGSYQSQQTARFGSSFDSNFNTNQTFGKSFQV